MQAVERARSLGKYRAYVAVESTDGDLSRALSSFLAESLRRPVEVRDGHVNVAITFLWSLLAKVASALEEMGEKVLDVDFGDHQTVIVTAGGHVVTILVKLRQSQYAAEVEGIVEVEEAPFRIEMS